MKISYPEEGGKKEDLKFNNSYGRYLISNHNTWHGGIHIEGAEGIKKIKAIADGRIIAYRLKNEYIFESETKSKVSTEGESSEDSNTADDDGKGYLYSNSFILIQHDIELSKTTTESDGEEVPEKTYVTFYSLYNHLMCLDKLKLKKNKEIPNFLRKTETKIIAKDQLGTKTKVNGLRGRIPVDIKGKKAIKWKREYDYTIKVTIPKGSTVTKDLDKDKKEIKLGNWAKVKYTDPNGKTYENIYISTSLKKDGTKRVSDDFELSYEILTDEDSGVFIDQSTIPNDKKNIEGAKVYQEKSESSKAIDIIKKDRVVVIKEKGDWVQIEGYEGYCRKKDIKEVISFDEGKTPEEGDTEGFMARDIPVLGGDLIGYTGFLQHDRDKSYALCQVDVFMEDGAEAFLKNDFGAGTEEEKKYLIIKKGTEIKKKLEISVDLEKGTKVNVLDIQDHYAKISIAPKPKPKEIKAVFETSFLQDQKKVKYHPVKGASYYTIVDKTLFPAINKMFDNKLPNSEVKLRWHIRCDKNGKALGGRLESRRKKEKELLDKNKVAYRSLKYIPEEESKKNQIGHNAFWIEITNLDEIAVNETVPKRIRMPKSISSTPKFIDFVTRPEDRFEAVTIETTLLKYLYPNRYDNTIEEKDLQDKIYSTKIDKKKYLIDNGRTYNIKPEYFDEVNKAFNGQLLGVDAILHYDSNVTIMHKNNIREKIIYKQKEHDRKLNWKNEEKFKECRPVRKGDKVELLSDVTKAYIAIPDSPKDIVEKKLEKDTVVVFKKAEQKELKKGVFYRKLKFEAINGNTKTVENGWINIADYKETDCFSAYNWLNFGFKSFQAGDEYMYAIQDFCGNTSTTSKFIETLWDKIDGIGNNDEDDLITNQELKAAYEILETRVAISKMVCQHKLEWSYKYEEIKDEITTFYDYVIEMFDSDLKPEFEKIKEEKLKGLKDKVDNLAFWDKVAKIPYTPRVKQEPVSTLKPKSVKLDFGLTYEERTKFGITTTVAEPKKEIAKKEEVKKEEPSKPMRIFPKSSELYHFHPIAFVNHLKLIFGNASTDYCIQEMKVRAFLRLIKSKEGVAGEAGYRQIYTGASFSDFSDHPRDPKTGIINGKPVTSDAAGAYQFKSSTWDGFKKKRKELGFKENDFSPLSQDYSALFYLQNVRTEADMKKYGQVESWGNIWVNKMIKKWNKKLKEDLKLKKKYSKKANAGLTKADFPKYKTRYKDAHGDIIEHLINNNLDRALRAAAPTWASFPDSINGQEPSGYTILEAKKNYREFLLKEIKGETDLHIEEGFLKKLGYKCCDTQNNTITGTSPEGKEPIDLRPTIPWHSQFTADTWGWRGRQGSRCYDTSLKILRDFCGLTAGGTRGDKVTIVKGRNLGGSDNVIQIALEEVEVGGKYTETNPVVENVQKGIDYLDQELEKGNPIIVGISHAYRLINPTKEQKNAGLKAEVNHDKSSDHYVIIVGRGYENGKRYFLFYEVGTIKSDKGQHDMNRLYVNADDTITGIPQHDLTKNYTITQIRGNKTNGNFK